MRIKIGGHIYKVLYVDLPADDAGVVDKTKGIIFIDKNLTKSEKEATLIHEILHIINSELDHVILDSLAQQLHQVLKQNKLF